MRLFIVLLLIASQAVAGVATLTGNGAVKDGDGILFGKVEVRLQGVAAPEMHDPGGREAKRALELLIKDSIVTCELDGTLARKRPVGICYVDGVDVGSALIKAGFARDCPNFSKGRYSTDERIAKESGRDLSLTYKLPGYC